MAGQSSAEGINGYAEFTYSLLDAKTIDPAGTVMTRSNTLNQRYNVTVDKNITPTFRFIGTALIDKNDSDTKSNGFDSDASTMRVNPTADLAYSNGMFSGGAGFNRRMEFADFNGRSAPTLYFDTWNARFGWKPEALPTLDILYTLFNNYDENKTITDSTTASTLISSRYKPHDTVDLYYSANYTDMQSRVAGFESQSLMQSFRVIYNDTYFRDLIALSSSYIISSQQTESRNIGGRSGSDLGLLQRQQLNQQFLATSAGIDDPLRTPNFGGSANPFAVSSISGTSMERALPTQERTVIGLQSTLAEVNIIRLPVAITFTTGHTITTEDYGTIRNAFGAAGGDNSRIRVYSSRGSDGANWTPVIPTAIVFGQLLNQTSGILTDGFEISFAEVFPSGTIIKIEINPAPSSTLQPFIQNIELLNPELYLQERTPLRPGQTRTSSQLSGQYNLNVKARLFNAPAVFYDFGLILDHTASDTRSLIYRYTVLNGLSLSHRLTPILTTSARIAREDTVDPQNGSRTSNLASISLSAQPLPTLTQSATYSFRQEDDAGFSRTTHSISLSNSAELYRGINLSLSAGGSAVTDSTQADQKSVSATAALNVLPHRTLSVNLTATDSHTWSSDRNRPDSAASSQIVELYLNYNPVPAIYLFSTSTINAQSGRKPQNIQSFGGSWSPFRGGTLLLSSSYRESFDSNQNKDKSLVESLRWNIRSGTYLDISYLISSGQTGFQKTETDVFSTTLRIGF